MATIPLTQLQRFVTVARLGNFTRAAEQTSLTVSALSHQIRLLEERLDRSLFERGPRGVVMTGEGRALFESVSHHFDAIEQAMATYQRRRDDVLTISSVPGLITGWLLPRLPSLVAAHPELELNLQSSNTFVDFEREPVDAGIRYGLGSWPGVESERLFGEWLVPVATPALIARMSHLDPEAIETWPLLGDTGTRWSEWFAQHGGRAPTRYIARFDTTEALQRAALEGVGVALGRMVMARPLLASGQLQTVGDHTMVTRECYYLVHAPRAKERPALVKFRYWLREQAASYRKEAVLAQ
jgi:LysR family glycine cleavage system transcriptional activator